MLRTKVNTQAQGSAEFVYIEQLVAPDHLLRKIQEHVDFSFIIDLVKDDYSENHGRPSTDPVVLFKMLLLGYLYGIRSESRLAEEVAHNVAYRWFLGFNLTDPTPGADVIWQNRHRRWKEKFDVYQGIFTRIVALAMEHGLVDGKSLYSDGTIIKANANKNKHKEELAKVEGKAYLQVLDEAVTADRAAHGKKPLPPRETAEETRTVKVSTTDPDSGFLQREGKPKCFAYTEHRTVDGKHNFVTDVHVTAATVHDSVPLTARLEYQMNQFGFKPDTVALDAGFATAWICHWLVENEIFGVIAHRRFQSVKGMLPKSKFTYDPETDRYHCPGDQFLTYRTTNRDGYREYASNPEKCKSCLLLPYCTKSRAAQKVITHHVWEDDKEAIRENRLSEAGKLIYAQRKETVERSFADAKELHGMRYAKMRGTVRLHEQCLLTATAQNIKKLARILDRRKKRAH